LQGNADFGDAFPTPRSYCAVATKLARAGDILLSVRAPVGAINVADQAYGIGRGLCAITPASAHSARYVFHCLEVMKAELFSIATGSTYEAVSIDQVRNATCLMPQSYEQILIAKFLDRETAKIDALVGEQRRLIELLKEKRQAVISHAVTKGLNPRAPMKPSGIKWFGDLPEHWQCGPLRRFWEVVDCKHVTVPFLDEGFPVASVMEVRTFDLDLSQVLRTSEEFYKLLISGDRQPLRGDVIYCRNTANTGTSAYVATDEPIAMGQDVSLIKSRGQNGRYLNYILHGESMAQQLETLMVGSTFKRINVADIKALMVVCPPRKEQDEIVEFIESQTAKFDALTAEAQRAIDLLQERRTALISAAVTGKIDVRGLAESEAA
jgi:type I restriction enzyme S subunit